MPIQKLSALAPGDTFTFLGLEDLGPHTLLRCSFTGATVRAMKRNRRTIETDQGDLVDFEAPGQRFLVGATTLVEKGETQ